MAEKTSLYLGEELKQALEERRGAASSTSALLNTMGDRYRQICQHCAPRLSPEAWGLLFDVLNGIWLAPAELAVLGIPHEVSDAIELNELDRKWGVDGARLLERLRQADYAELVAIADAAERFWARHEELPGEPAEFVAALGLPSAGVGNP